MQSMRSERKRHGIRHLLRYGEVGVLAGAMALSIGHIPAKRTDTVQSNGYITAEGIAEASRITGSVHIDKIISRSMLKCYRCDNRYVDVTRYTGPFSIQLNTNVIGEGGGKSKEFLVQNVIITKEPESGKLYYYHLSEIFELKKDGNPVSITRGSLDGKGRLYNPFNYDPETMRIIPSRTNTYLYHTAPEPLKFPLNTTLSVKVGVVKGFLEINFEYYNRKSMRVRFDTVRIGRRGEYSSGYIYADYNNPTSLGIVGDGNMTYAYIRRLNGYMGMVAKMDGHEIPIRYAYNGGIQSAERSINMAVILPQNNGMVGITASYKRDL